jgi:hypothetical protein
MMMRAYSPSGLHENETHMSLVVDFKENLMQDNNDDCTERVIMEKVKTFYQDHGARIKLSHGIDHVRKVYQHAVQAIACHIPVHSS